MTAYYRARISVGPYAWDIEQGDPWAYGPVDGLKITAGFPDAEPWPGQPQPTRLDLGVVVAQAQDFDQVDVGAQVTVILYYASDPDPTKCVLGYFFGRVSDMDSAPDPDGMLYTLVAHDHLVELNSRYAGDLGQAPADFMDATDAVDQWWSEAGLPSPWYFLTPPSGHLIRGLGDDNRPLMELTSEVLRSYVYDSEPWNNWGMRGSITPQVFLDMVAGTHELNEDQPYQILWKGNRISTVMPHGYLPARLRNQGGGVWGPVVDTADTNTPDASPGVPSRQMALDASMVDFGAKWNRNRAHAVDVVEIPYTSTATGKAKTYRLANNSDPQSVTYVLPGARAVHSGDFLHDLAFFNLPDPGEGGLRWQVDKFRIYASEDPQAFTNSGGYRVWTNPTYMQVAPVLAIGGIPEGQNPNPGHQPFYAGMVRQVELVIQDGDYYADVVLDPTVPRAAKPDPDNPAQRAYLCASETTTAQDAVTWAQLEPTFTHYDMRLVRRDF